jgi:hypothetical protein
MATMTVNTPHGNEQRSMSYVLRGFRAELANVVGDCMQHAVSEGSRVRLFGSYRTESRVTQNLDRGEALGAGLKRPDAPFTRQVESRPRAAASLGRKIARSILTAILTLAALAGTVALQAAIHVYVLRLTG